MTLVARSVMAEAPRPVRIAIDGCTECEPERTPRPYICTYHDGFWDGWITATDAPENDIPKEVHDD